MKKLFLATLMLTITVMSEIKSSQINETTRLLGQSKQKENTPQNQKLLPAFLTDLPSTTQLHILKYIAADTKNGLKTINSLLRTSKKHNEVFAQLCAHPYIYQTNEGQKYARESELEKLTKNNMHIMEPKNVQHILKTALEKKDKETETNVYNALTIEPRCSDNCQDYFACALPLNSPWGKQWENVCQKTYKNRVQAKYGITLDQTAQVQDYKKYQEAKKTYLGAGLWLLMCSTRTLAQLALCPLCACSYGIGHDFCNRKDQDRKNFAEGKTACGWLHWPCDGVFKCCAELSDNSSYNNNYVHLPI